MVHIHPTRHVTSGRITLISRPPPSRPSLPTIMAPTVSRSQSQSKISDTFRSSSKVTKPLKQTTSAVQRVTKSVSPPATKANKSLNDNDPKLRALASKIESDRQAPFGNILLC